VVKDLKKNGNELGENDFEIWHHESPLLLLGFSTNGVGDPKSFHSRLKEVTDGNFEDGG